MKDDKPKLIHPTHAELVELWMKTHHDGVPAAVFFNPLADDGNRIKSLMDKLKLNEDQVVEAIMCDVFIHLIPIIPIDGIYNFVESMDQDVYGFVMAWDGAEFTSNN